MTLPTVSILPAQEADLDAINGIISACVMSWNLPERVKRLSIGSYQYSGHDLEYLQIFIALKPGGKVVGILALENASTADLPEEQSGLLLHGLYVSPEEQGKGTGYTLLQFALDIVANKNLNGLLVKAQPDANSYFEKHGFDKLPIFNPGKHYPHRWWKAL